MYLPRHFQQPDTALIHQLMQQQPLATVVTHGEQGLVANHVPLHLEIDDSAQGVLRGHVARNNPLWRETQAHAQVLAIFHGPDAYISPTWYPSKQEHGKAVPTWNYVVAHAHGPLTVHDDAHWLRTHLQALTATHENNREPAWQMSDAPADYLQKMMAAVVGIEIRIERLDGKWKLSQNQPEANREGVVLGLQQAGSENARIMVERMKASE